MLMSKSLRCTDLCQGSEFENIPGNSMKEEDTECGLDEDINPYDEF